jgi:uncharacterized membrane protein
MSTASAASTLPRTKREEWIDVLRGLAVIGMIWTHACNTFLQRDLQTSAFFAQLSYWHGLVAPTFFYLAGYNRGQSTARPGPAKPAWPTVKRLLFILGIGYFMHAPWLALINSRLDAAAWRMALMVDVLQCLAVSCLILLAVEVWFKRWALPLAVALTLAVLQFSFSGYTTGWLFIDSYLTRQHGSIFPLLPWLGFALWGYIMALVPMPQWWRASIGFVLAFLLPRLLQGWGYGSQLFFLERVGWVMIFAATLAGSWDALTGKIGPCLKSVGLVGRQSLLCYVAHLLMIHALPLCSGQSLEFGIGATLSWPAVIGMFALLLLATVALAYAWHQSKWRAKHR